MEEMIHVGSSGGSHNEYNKFGDASSIWMILEV